ncbi:hypothetical protein MVEN_01698800 [Mycena venus]|uniref:Uncharacterized protein n=1 Tax=Mycena venus TaxID=2733690 RepID=A0A8H6XPG5_9AGAR|nr:hypothetical protein MVEN_01698800 [Mycena venus]
MHSSSSPASSINPHSFVNNNLSAPSLRDLAKSQAIGHIEAGPLLLSPFSVVLLPNCLLFYSPLSFISFIASITKNFQAPSPQTATQTHLEADGALLSPLNQVRSFLARSWTALEVSGRNMSSSTTTSYRTPRHSASSAPMLHNGVESVLEPTSLPHAQGHKPFIFGALPPLHPTWLHPCASSSFSSYALAILPPPTPSTSPSPRPLPRALPFHHNTILGVPPRPNKRVRARCPEAIRASQVRAYICKGEGNASARDLALHRVFIIDHSPFLFLDIHLPHRLIIFIHRHLSTSHPIKSTSTSSKTTPSLKPKQLTGPGVPPSPEASSVCWGPLIGAARGYVRSIASGVVVVVVGG